MAVVTTYSSARAQLARLLDKVTKDRETVVIERRGADRVVMIAEAEFTGLEETAHLLRSPKNAERLLGALLRAQKGKVRPRTVDRLKVDVGLADGQT
jgi:antitoxin YefM